MNSDGALGVMVVSDDPFSDSFAIDVQDAELFNGDVATPSEMHNKIAYTKTTIDVPILDSLPRLTAWASLSSTSTSSTFPSPVLEYFARPIQWTKEDLMYLLSCLLPDPILTNTLFFSPPLADLHSTPPPLQLRLYKKLPVRPPPPEAFSQDAPIGTGRPQSKALIAESEVCSTPEAARASLARALVADASCATYMHTRYNVLAALYASSAATLLSLQRGMIEMLGVDDDELDARFACLYGQVDGECSLDARMEVYLLGVGRLETEALVTIVEVARGMSERERWVWSEVYGDAAAFLGSVGVMFM